MLSSIPAQWSALVRATSVRGPRHQRAWSTRVQAHVAREHTLLRLFKPLLWEPLLLTSRTAQLSMLLEGIDWRMPVRTHMPEMAV